MRVIAGELKGRKLKAVPGKSTRPTADKIKEATFHMMGPFFQGGNCLDLFAGSGSLAIEAISRGMDYAVFIDKQPQAIKTINDNIKALKLENKTEVFKIDALKGIRLVAKKGLSFDLVLIDPPYERADYESMLSDILKHQLLNENGLIYCEHTTEKKLPFQLPDLEVIKQLNYGSTTGITIYRSTK